MAGMSLDGRVFSLKLFQTEAYCLLTWLSFCQGTKNGQTNKQWDRQGWDWTNFQTSAGGGGGGGCQLAVTLGVDRKAAAMQLMGVLTFVEQPYSLFTLTLHSVHLKKLVLHWGFSGEAGLLKMNGLLAVLRRARHNTSSAARSGGSLL